MPCVSVFHDLVVGTTCISAVSVCVRAVGGWRSECACVCVRPWAGGEVSVCVCVCVCVQPRAGGEVSVCVCVCVCVY